ncbi:MAG: single-strand selective monofunctional uracil-DNA glycosylase [Puniceicoccaceae bacterium]|nr:MAG: single-strand selective monofunctional uracil-DNA glycosylase [Puniceicoccaceae bacterium]
MPSDKTAQKVTAAAAKLRDAVMSLPFTEPVAYTYNPLDYAWKAHETYCRRFAQASCRVLFMGMNPGPFGMAQTGVPFGEVAAVRDWMGICTEVRRPSPEHPKRKIEGFACERSEVSGRRLWGLFAERFEKPELFFADHFVLNYCPLVFMGETGRNITPDKLPVKEAEALFGLCDQHLAEVVSALKPDWVIGVGAFAEGRAKMALPDFKGNFGRILHPSPASPAANRDWAGTVTKQLLAMGL